MGEHDTLSPNVVRANVYFSFSGGFFLRCLAQEILLVNGVKESEKYHQQVRIHCLLVLRKTNASCLQRTFLSLPSSQQNSRYLVLQLQPKGRVKSSNSNRQSQENYLVRYSHFLVIPNSRTLLFTLLLRLISLKEMETLVNMYQYISQFLTLVLSHFQAHFFLATLFSSVLHLASQL